MALSACNDKNSPIKADSTLPWHQPPRPMPPGLSPQPMCHPMQTRSTGWWRRLRLPGQAGGPDPGRCHLSRPDQRRRNLAGANPGLQRTALSNAVNAQNWDPSVKSLTQFPNVLEQMASNLPWTTALGKAYYNDPSDVMNAIQVMRNRAYKAGTLKTSSQLKVNLPPRQPPWPICLEP
jgi:hypothetical protein